jgi:hypothetical protein
MTNPAKRLLYDVTRILTARWVSTALGEDKAWFKSPAGIALTV